VVGGQSMITKPDPPSKVQSQGQPSGFSPPELFPPDISSQQDQKLLLKL